MEMLVFSLFNYGSDSREAFLLLQLFTEALQHEIRCSHTHTITHTHRNTQRHTHRNMQAGHPPVAG